MRGMAIVVVGVALTGCSLLYNPNNLPPPSIDAPVVDADPSMLRLDGAGPAQLLEGQGTDGTRPAILAITGQNFVASATVRVFATGSETPMITVNNDPKSMAQISSTSDVLAVSVTLPIDTKLPATPTSAMQDIPLTIEVSQAVGDGLVTKTLTGVVTLRTLPELIAATDSASLRPMYSQVDLSGPLTFTAAPNTPRALIRSASTIRLKNVTVSANGNAPGPGGATGGTANMMGGGGPSGGAGALASGGGGGGFATAGGDGTGKGGAPNGDPLISSYASNISAGGGGGTVTGGGGGGTLELTAAGDISVGAIAANGGAGTGGAVGVGGGGGGAGGIVLIRSGGTATLGGAITASAGAGGAGLLGPGGAGSIGRTRIDAPKIVGSPTVTPPYHIGASFDPATPLTAKTSPFAIQLFGTVADKFDVVVLDGNGGASSPPFTADFGNATMITVRPVLQPGFNRVCVTKNGGSVTVIEATNCIDVAYLP